MMKNIIARRIPTFNIKESGAVARLFSNLIKASRRKKIVAPINRSTKNIKKKVLGLPKNILKTSRSNAVIKNSCN
jgi:hypothetical protein